MKNVLLFGYGKMGSSIARGWILKELNFNFFIIEKEASLRKIATKDGFKTYENIENINETKIQNFLILFFLQLSLSKWKRLSGVFTILIYINQFLFLLQLDCLFLGLEKKLIKK